MSRFDLISSMYSQHGLAPPVLAISVESVKALEDIHHGMRRAQKYPFSREMRLKQSLTISSKDWEAAGGSRKLLKGPAHLVGSHDAAWVSLLSESEGIRQVVQAGLWVLPYPQECYYFEGSQLPPSD